MRCRRGATSGGSSQQQGKRQQAEEHDGQQQEILGKSSHEGLRRDACRKRAVTRGDDVRHSSRQKASDLGQCFQRGVVEHRYVAREEREIQLDVVVQPRAHESGTNRPTQLSS